MVVRGSCNSGVLLLLVSFLELEMIECYYSTCPNHLYVLESQNGVPDEMVSGPFCSDNKCTATQQQIDEYQVIRTEELKKYKLS